MDNLYLETCRDHNATSYSTETQGTIFVAHENIGRDHNATSYSTENSAATALDDAGSGQRS